MKKLKVVLVTLVGLTGCTSVGGVQDLKAFESFKVVAPKDLEYTLEYGSEFNMRQLGFDLLKDAKFVEVPTLPTEVTDEIITVKTTAGDKTFKLIILDTQGPVIEGDETLSIVVGDIVDIASLYIAKDLVDGDLEVSVSEYSTTVAGTQILTITAVDKNGNEASKEVSLRVEAKSVGNVSKPQPNRPAPNPGNSGNNNSGGSDSGSKPPEVTIDVTSLANEMHSLVNAERVSVGVAPLVFDQRLFGSAKIRALELTVLFSHTRPSGESVFSLDPGYIFGENISYGYSSAASAVRGFMDSPGHKENILRQEFKSAAYGVVMKEGSLYWVQLFGY